MRSQVLRVGGIEVKTCGTEKGHDLCKSVLLDLEGKEVVSYKLGTDTAGGR